MTSEPFSEEMFARIREGDRLRVVFPYGRTIVGAVEYVKTERRTEKYGEAPSAVYNTVDVIVCGVHVNSHTKSVIFDGSGLPDLIEPKLSPSQEAVRDVIADLSADTSYSAGPRAVSFKVLTAALIGFDPSIGRQSAEFGGKTPEGWAAEHLMAGHVKKRLAELVDDGVLRPVREGTFRDKSTDPTYVTFPYGIRSGWVLADAYDDSVAAVTAKRDATRLAKLRDQARATIADRHAEEVEEELQRLLNDQI
ncbi:hypothetical protein [Leifsonia sp. Leaf264]|uniref:hypothetical protein n=1 Tax=Leifsonia sp. Leaf264 TaxID=1736314 RepID=UPI0006FAA1A6|nr:hypothetical protein [Leifsonia sp. Leaf264]KQO98793.1 hypothetical protein ASF30_12080 [Leifsonia sp. Leaf264]